MARPGLMPIVAAVALTMAAGLSIAAERARSSPAAAGPQAQGTAAAAPPLAVGSRALTGSEEGGPWFGPARPASDRASE